MCEFGLRKGGTSRPSLRLPGACLFALESVRRIAELLAACVYSAECCVRKQTCALMFSCATA